MIRHAEIVRFLDSMSETLVADIRPDLNSAHARKCADSLIFVVNRMAAEFRDGETIAAERLGAWQELSRDLLDTEPAAPKLVGNSVPLQKLDTVVSGLQRELTAGPAFDRLVAGLKGPAAPRAGWFQKAADSMFNLMEALEDSVQPIPPAQAGRTVVENIDGLRVKLNAYLARRFPELPSQAIGDFRLTPGGNVKQTILFTLPANSALPSRLVLRLDMPNSITGTSVVDEYPVMQRVYGLGLPVPEPLFLESDASILGGSFMVMTEVVGATIAGTYFAKERAQEPRDIGPDFGRETAAVMARLHRLTEVPEAERSGPEENHLDDVRAVYEIWLQTPKPPLSISIDLGFAWLFSHPMPPGRPRCLVHEDFSMHNIMVRDGHFAALLDWELAKEGDPSGDVAEARMMMLEDVMPWEEFVAAYIEAGGDPRACDPHAIAYQSIWHLTYHYVMNAKAREYFVSGERNDHLAAAIAAHFADRLLQYQARAVKLARDLMD